MFIRDHLGPLLHAQHRDTQIWLFDHDYSYYQRVATQLQDKQLAQYVSGVAWHGYTGTPDQMSIVHRDNLPFYWTEGGTLSGRSRITRPAGPNGQPTLSTCCRTGAAVPLPGT